MLLGLTIVTILGRKLTKEELAKIDKELAGIKNQEGDEHRFC